LIISIAQIEMGQSFSDASSLSRDEVLRNFEKHKEISDGYISTSTPLGHGTYFARFTNPSGTNAKASPRLDNDKNCSKVCIEQLSVGRTHGKCILVGRVLKHGIYSGGAYFVFEDTIGDLIKVGVYNACESGRHAAALFPVGRSLSIADPYMKCGADGQPFVRVDNPDCVQDFDFPKDAQGWHDMGNDLFKVLNSSSGRGVKACPAAVTACWRKALALVPLTPLCTLLSNRAAAWMELGDYASAAQDSAVASFLDPGHVKANYRLALALREAGLREVSGHICHRGVQQWPSNAAFRELKKSLLQEGDLERTGGSGGALSPLWWEDSRVVGSLSSGPHPHPHASDDDDDDDDDASSEQKQELDQEQEQEQERDTSQSRGASTASDSPPVSCEGKGKEEEASWDVLKCLGNTAFKEGRYSAAVECYTRALAAVHDIDRVVSLHCNLSLLLSSSKEGGGEGEGDADRISALRCAVIALVIKPNHTKAWLRRAQALRAVQRGRDALRSCEEGLRSLLGVSADPATSTLRAHLEKLQRELKKEEGVSDKKRTEKNAKFASAFSPFLATASGNKKLSTAEQLRQRKEMEAASTLEDVASPQSMATFNMLNNMFLDKDKQVQLYGYEIAPLADFRHELYNADCCWPQGVSFEFAENFLESAYQNGVSLPHNMEFSLCNDSYSPPNEWFMKRLNGRVDRIKWYSAADRRVGDVCDDPPSVDTKYHSFVRHSYSNQAYRMEIFHRGKTHVAVGFVDLGLLLSSQLRDDNTTAPLRFVGFDLSAYAVAKTLVIWAMFLHPTVSSGEGSGVDAETLSTAILQVWFSSVWTRGTAALFAVVVKKLVQSEEKIRSRYGNEVWRLLQHWSRAKGVLLSRAMQQWSEFRSDARSSLPHLLRKKDRIAMARYELTGAFGVTASGSTDGENGDLVGSVTMFDCPDGTPPLADNETVFSTVQITTLFPADGSRTCVTEALRDHLLGRIRRLLGWAQSSAVVVELHCAAVEDSVGAIAAFRPWTMSWSNVLDYIPAEKFHDIARACSVHHDIIHFGYSMNWMTQVYGASFLDLLGMFTEKRKKKMILDCNAKFSQAYQQLNCQARLRSPPPSNPLNNMATLLEANTYSKWLQWWIAKGCARGEYCKTAPNCEHSTPNPLSCTGSSTMYLTWTYDREITFNREVKMS
jgi:tetratricopeptide (TPR) repeat protein